MVPRLRATSEFMGKPERFFLCGGMGSGLVAKIANNYLCGINLLGAMESFNFALRSGVDKKVLFDVIHESTGQSFMLDKVCPVSGVVDVSPANNNWKLGFKTPMMVKDVGLGVEHAKLVDAPTELGTACMEFWAKAAHVEECKEIDCSSVYKYMLHGPD